MNEKEEKFVEKRQFAIPLETFVEMDISEEQRAKILKWIDDGDIIGVFPYATGLPRLVLTNQTKLDKWNRKKKKQ
jgi:hypothetical protein